MLITRIFIIPTMLSKEFLPRVIKSRDRSIVYRINGQVYQIQKHFTNKTQILPMFTIPIFITEKLSPCEHGTLCGKTRNSCSQHLFSFPKCFQKPVFSSSFDEGFTVCYMKTNKDLYVFEHFLGFFT